jgi:hypothetical protein
VTVPAPNDTHSRSSPLTHSGAPRGLPRGMASTKTKIFPDSLDGENGRPEVAVGRQS